jgi:alpha-glucosidase
MISDATRWWTEGVLYQIYPRSFVDSNGDGIGDLRGIIGKLDYLEWLGVTGVWLNPTMDSPNTDWGYDVSDYKSVHRELGTMEDLEELIGLAGQRGIRILLDFVPNHTSDRHKWFLDSRSSKDSARRDWYVWTDPKPDGSAPNNWRSVFGGSAWEYDDATGQYYLHNFLDTQADLNWWNEDVRNEMDDVVRFWFDRGVAGFRIDVAHAVIKDRELRDNLPARPEDDREAQKLGQQHTYNMDQPEVHEVIRRWRKLAESYDPPRILLGETFLLDLARMAAYYGTGDELNMAFNFPFVFSTFEAKQLREVVELTESVLPPLAWPVWTGSNHDVLRFPSRWCEGDELKTRLALMVLLTLRGTPVLYYGDEIGMLDTHIPRAELKDPVGQRFWREGRGRDSCRTPMQWTAADGAGFSPPGVEPWLRYGDYRARNVEDQKDDDASTLSFCRALIDLRRESEDLRRGDYEAVESPEKTWVFRRGSTTIALNFSDEETAVSGSATVTLSTDPARNRGRVGELTLAPWEGVILGPE